MGDQQEKGDLRSQGAAVQGSDVPDLDDVLGEVNALRAQYSLPPITRLPSGERGAYARCALVNALNDAHCVSVWPSKRGGTYFYDHVERALPRVLNQFARAFDQGQYPDLEKSA